MCYPPDWHDLCLNMWAGTQFSFHSMAYILWIHCKVLFLVVAYSDLYCDAYCLTFVQHYRLLCNFLLSVMYTSLAHLSALVFVVHSRCECSLFLELPVGRICRVDGTLSAPNQAVSAACATYSTKQWLSQVFVCWCSWLSLCWNMQMGLGDLGGLRRRKLENELQHCSILKAGDHSFTA